MELLIILIGIVMIGAVLVVPAVRRARAGKAVQRGGALAEDLSAYGFLPAERLDPRLPGPDPRLTEVLSELRGSQEWESAARLLALTDTASEQRWQRVQTLAGAAAHELAQSPGQGGVWLRTWRVQAPEDPGGAALQAQFLVVQALRDPSSEDFRMIMEEARTVCAEAARLAPGDPIPLIIELAVARGLAYREADFQELWARVHELAPQHMGAHLAALSYWSQKWHGSQEQAESFARRVAASAPEGSLLSALPLFAVFDHLPEVNLVGTLFQSAVITEAIEGARYAVHHAPADHPMAPHVRHLLAWFLIQAERYGEAIEQLRHVDGHVGALPWSFHADPASAYAAHRAVAVAGWERRGGTAAQLPRP